MNNLKSLQIIGQVLMIKRIADANGNINDATGQPITDARGNTHQMVVKQNPIIDSVNAKIAQFLRVGTDRPNDPVTFCLTKDNGDYVLNISMQTAIQIASTCGVQVNALPIVAGEAKINAMVNVKEQGDEFIRRGSASLEQYTKTHARLDNISLSISQSSKMALLAVTMSTDNYTPAPSAPVVEEADPFQAAIEASQEVPATAKKK